MQIRKIMHQERMIAMKKGISFEDLNHESMAQELTQMNEKTNMLEIGDLNHVPQATFT